MLATMRPYTPSLYRTNGYARYRQYPRQVDTPIPGAGYHVGKMVWAEQPLNLDGSLKPQPYGDYAKVPLRGTDAGLFDEDLFGGDGMGQSFSFSVDPSLQWSAQVRTGDEPVIPAAAPVAPEIEEKTNWLPWALGAGALALVGGGAYLMLRKKKVKPNRRRSRRNRRRRR